MQITEELREFEKTDIDLHRICVTVHSDLFLFI